MVQTNTFRELMNCSAPPDIDSAEFIPWCYEYVARRIAPCFFKRLTVRYIDADNGDDARSGETPATSGATGAWASIDPVRTEVQTNNRQGWAFLFRQGMEYRVTGGQVLIDQPGNYFGSYGPNIALPTYSVGNIAALYASPGSADFQFNFVNQKPRFSFWTMRWLGSSASWTNSAGDRWSTTVGAADINPNIGPGGGTAVTRVGWLRVRGAGATRYGFLSYAPPLKCVDSTAKVEATAFTWYCDSSGNLHVNAGTGVDPNNYDFEGVPSTAATTNGCFDVQDGGTNTLFEGLIGDGFDCDAWNQKNASFIRFNQSNDDVAVALDCESYYNGRHAMSSEHQTAGGYAVVIGGRAGLCNPIHGASCFNSFGSDGNHETVFMDTWNVFGDLPNDVAGSIKTLAHSEARCTSPWYGHVGFTGSPGTGTASDPVGLYLNIDCGLVDLRDKFPGVTANLTSFAFDVSKPEYSGRFFDNFSDKTPGSGRAYVIGYQCESHAESTTRNEAYFGAPGPLCFLNSHLRARLPNGKDWGNNPPAIHTSFWAYCLNSVLEYIYEGVCNNLGGAANNIGQIFQGAVSTSSVTRDREARLMSCLLIVRGSTAVSVGSNDFVVINHGAQGEDLVRLANTIVLADRYKSAQGIQVRLSNLAATSEVLNETDSLRYVAVAGCLVSNTGNWRGFDQATGFLNLETLGTDYPLLASFMESGLGLESSAIKSGPRFLDPDGQLAGAGAWNPFPDKSDMGKCPKFDYWGRPRRRRGRPSIGPFDVIEFVAGNGAGAGSVGGIIRDCIR